jgi:ferritin-like metal-binding protein YciE
MTSAAIAAAGELRMDRADKLLDATVAEEKKTDQALTQLAETLVNPGG